MCGPAPNKELARSVARLAIRLETGTYAYCTGFAIGPNHLLTNNHCIEQLKEPACSGIQIEFNYTCAAAELSSVVQPQCVRVIRRNSPTLDYAVIEFKAPVGTVPPLKPARAVPGVGKTFLLHHSAGMAMRRGMSNRAIARLDVSQAEKDRISEARADCSSSVYPVDKYFTEPTATERERVITHAVNTTAGASGAPVFVGDQVVGLHFDRDKRYYPLPEKCFDAGVENCMVRKLGLPNWAVPVCDVLDDIAGSVPGLQRCAK
jgi:hypothetical protein